MDTAVSDTFLGMGLPGTTPERRGPTNNSWQRINHKPVPVSIQEGSILHDRYEIRKFLGKGASGTVYLGFDYHAGHEVALKVFPAALRNNKLAAGRLHREIRSAHKIDSKYVTRMYNCHITDDYILLVLEYVPGQALSDYLKRNPSIPIGKICRIIRQVARGLEAIHEQKIIHRDIKLENIMISNDGTVKITDFGISLWDNEDEIESLRDRLDGEELPDEFTKRLTLAGKVVGTLQYISPEYLLGEKCDERSDIYALGVLIYELITGKYLYEFKNHADLMEKKVTVDPARPVHIRPDCPEWLSNLCMKALDRKPAKRFQSAREVALEFDRPGVLFASDQSVDSSTIVDTATRTCIRELRERSGSYQANFVRQGYRRNPISRLLSLVFQRPVKLALTVVFLLGTTAVALNPNIKERAVKLFDRDQEVTVPASTTTSVTVAAKPIVRELPGQ